MIISTGRKFVFVHIPKTGGTALALALEERAMKDDILIGDTPKAVRRRGRLKNLTARGRLWKHSTLRDIDGIVTPDALDAMLVVILVRNPWDRMVSYYHWLRAQGFEHPAVTLAQSVDFKSFVHHPQTQVGLMRNGYESYVTDVRGRVHDQMMIRLECFDADAAAFVAHLGFDLKLPWANRSERLRDWRAYYDDATRELIGTLCQRDIARFGYDFDGLT